MFGHVDFQRLSFCPISFAKNDLLVMVTHLLHLMTAQSAINSRINCFLQHLYLFCHDFRAVLRPFSPKSCYSSKKQVPQKTTSEVGKTYMILKVKFMYFPNIHLFSYLLVRHSCKYFWLHVGKNYAWRLEYCLCVMDWIRNWSYKVSYKSARK